jgi:MFS family permease
MSTSDAADAKADNAKLWTRNFLLLWQGQFVSAVGDVVYEIALGFWVLAVSGSTALMGTLLAASTIPRVLLSPVAGVVVDRSDRKKLLVTMDFVRGIFVLLVATAAFMGTAQIWMVFIVGIANGMCAAFLIRQSALLSRTLLHERNWFKLILFFL